MKKNINIHFQAIDSEELRSYLLYSFEYFSDGVLSFKDLSKGELLIENLEQARRMVYEGKMRSRINFDDGSSLMIKQKTDKTFFYFDFVDRDYSEISKLLGYELLENLNIVQASSRLLLGDVEFSTPTLEKIDEEGILNCYEIFGDQIRLFSVYNFEIGSSTIKIPKEIMLSAPAKEVKELENGNVYMLLASDLPFEGFSQEFYDNYLAVYEHIKSCLGNS